MPTDRYLEQFVLVSWLHIRRHSLQFVANYLILLLYCHSVEKRVSLRFSKTNDFVYLNGILIEEQANPLQRCASGGESPMSSLKIDKVQF